MKSLTIILFIFSFCFPLKSICQPTIGEILNDGVITDAQVIFNLARGNNIDVFNPQIQELWEEKILSVGNQMSRYCEESWTYEMDDYSVRLKKACDELSLNNGESWTPFSEKSAFTMQDCDSLIVYVKRKWLDSVREFGYFECGKEATIFIDNALKDRNPAIRDKPLKWAFDPLWLGYRLPEVKYWVLK